ncbi:hypothetical protein HDV06_006077 [Boothiomyces sp. JEL0866]|nr:hypothetical protein HDV06_006027 [Boothiomyces sp. JEL0866]KAJ3324819.1 hypothetical protein HDV06_006077 [Boothiomyces sp. JEL0866]
MNVHSPLNLSNACRHTYLSGNTLISLNIIPEIAVARKESSYFHFAINSNTPGTIVVKIIGTETVFNKKAEDHVFLSQEYKISPNINQSTDFQLGITSDGLLNSVKLANGCITYRAEFYYNKANICKTNLNVIIPTSFADKVLSNYRMFANSSNLLFSIEGSRVLLLHSEDDLQFLISPFRPKLIVVGSQKIQSVRYSIVEETAVRVKYRRSSWDPYMNVIQKEEKSIVTVELLEGDFEYHDGSVLMPLEIFRLDNFVEADVKGNYITIKHTLSVCISVSDGNSYTLKVPIQVIAN